MDLKLQCGTGTSFWEDAYFSYISLILPYIIIEWYINTRYNVVELYISDANDS